MLNGSSWSIPIHIKMPVLHIVPSADSFKLYEARVAAHNETCAENSGFDLIIPTDVRIESTTMPTLVDSGIRAEMLEDDGSSGGYMLVPRSSICKVPIRQHNGVGIIDPGYRGPIKIPITGTVCDVTITSGARYFQLVHPTLKPFRVKIVAELTPSKRDTGGFGSTGNEGTVVPGS
jgi:dUTP pyrophosphatase